MTDAVINKHIPTAQCNAELLDELKHAQCARPFEQLGCERHGDIVNVTSWQPNACKVELLPLDPTNHKVLALMDCLDAEGLFQTSLETPEHHFRLRVTYRNQDGSESSFTKHDAYQFPEQRFDHQHWDRSRLYNHQGAHLCSVTIDGIEISGTRFVVFAPNARSVSLIGDFNHWNGSSHPMASSEHGNWHLFVPGMNATEAYKYEIKSQHGDVLPHKIDPYGFSIDQFPSFASRVYDHDTYQWQDNSWQNRPAVDPRETPMSIYEVQLCSWRRDENNQPLTYAELTRQLIPYVVEMGYTHLELLPITEYPFDGSWGYQPVGLYAPTSRFGNPDDFKAFVDACHQAGIAVILDWVPAHFPTDGHGLANFDGTPLFEYEDPKRGWHKDWNSLIYDYGRETVCDYLISNAVYWLDKFHLDGLRVDAVASMLYLDYARDDGEWIPNVDGGNENYEAITFLRRLNELVYLNYPKTLMIAEESTSFPGVSKPTFEGGLGFGFKWNMGWMNDSLRYMQKDHIYRKYHHNELTFSMVYAFDEHFVLPLSHDEVVHGKKSLMDKMPGDVWQKFSNLRAFMGYMYAHPGKKLNFMGNEFAQGAEWNHSKSLDWHLLDIDFHKGQQRLMSDLNHLYKNEPALYERDFSGEGFSWLAADDAENSVLSMVRFGADKRDHIIAISNMTPQTRVDYNIGVPSAGTYAVVLNTDSSHYAGSDFIVGDNFKAQSKPMHGQSYSIQLNVPALATVFLKPVPVSVKAPQVKTTAVNKKPVKAKTKNRKSKKK